MLHAPGTSLWRMPDNRNFAERPPGGPVARTPETSPCRLDPQPGEEDYLRHQAIYSLPMKVDSLLVHVNLLIPGPAQPV
jgi:hypothetical protein